jgi:phenol hydroxylase P0 protein
VISLVLSRFHDHALVPPSVLRNDALMHGDAIDTSTTSDAPAHAPAKPDAPDALPQRKFVRVIERHPNGLVRFEFAVGWPDLSCELVLPQADFDEFCRRHAVEFMTEPADAGINTLPPSEPSQP